MLMKAMSLLLSCAMVLSMASPGNNLLKAEVQAAEAIANNATEITEEDTIKIIDYNVYVGEMTGTENALDLRAERAIKLFKQYKPDSMGFQEASVHWMTLLDEGLKDEYAWVGVGRDNGTNDAASGEASPIFYLKDKYDLVDSGTFWLSETPEKPSYGWDAECRRVCTWVVLKNKHTGETYAHVNTHLDHVGQQARINGMNMVIDKIKEFDVPVVCTGDFNTSENSDIYNQMINTGFMNDSKKVADVVLNSGSTMANFNMSTNLDSGAAIDFIFVSQDEIKVSKYKVLRDLVDGKFISDHLGVYAEMSLKTDESRYQAKNGTATVDGTMDKSYLRSKAVQVNVDSSGKAVKDATAEVRTIYDENYIYSFAHVKDSAVNSDTTRPDGTNYGIDGMQFFYDFKNDGENSWVSANSGYFIVDLVGTDNLRADGKTAIDRHMGGFQSFKGTDKMQYTAVKTDDGYDMEIRVALPDELRARLEAGETDIEIGTGFQVNDDSTDDGKRDTAAFSNKSIASAYMGCNYFEKMVLVGSSEQGKQTVDSSKLYYVAVEGTPEVDGVADDVYADAPAIPVNKNSSNSVIDNPEVATAKARVLYDKEYIYCFVDVKDRYVNDPATVAQSTNYGIDDIQYFFDFLNNDADNATESDYTYSQDGGVENHERGYMMLYANNRIPFTTYGFSGSFAGKEENLKYVSKIGGNGWQIEMRLKLSDSLKARLAEGNENIKIGIGFQINDDTDDDGTRNNTIFSDADLASGWMSPVYFQDILLGIKGDLPTYPVEEEENSNYFVKDVTVTDGDEDGKLEFTWNSNIPKSGKVQIVKKSQMTGEQIPVASSIQTIANIDVTKEEGLYVNSAEIYGLDTNTEYVFRVGSSYAWSENIDVKTAEPKLSAEDMINTDEATGLVVTVPAGNIPAASVITAENVTSGEAYDKALRIEGIGSVVGAYNVAVTYKNTEVIPTSGIKVSLPVAENDKLHVYAMNAEGKYVEVSYEYNNGNVEFSTTTGLFAVVREKEETTTEEITTIGNQEETTTVDEKETTSGIKDEVITKATEGETTTVAPTTAATKKAVKDVETTKATADKAVKAPAKVKKVTAKKKASKKVKVTIKKVKNAEGYQVQFSKTKKFNKKNILVKKVVKKVKTTIASKKLKGQKKLFIRARAYVLDANGKKVYGKWSNVKKVK